MRNFDYKYYAELIHTFNKTQPLIGNNKIPRDWLLYCLKTFCAYQIPPQHVLLEPKGIWNTKPCVVTYNTLYNWKELSFDV